jgi:5-methylcytosine-specific restriction enzyme subunit McrC
MVRRVAVVREYAQITCGRSVPESIDRAHVTRATFEWLVALQSSWKGEGALMRLTGSSSLRLENYVGYLESPAGEGIEVLPKTSLQIPEGDELAAVRALLRGMVMASTGIPAREAEEAALQRRHEPLHEWVVARFLSQLRDLVQRGLRFDYVEVEESGRLLRGRLDQVRQLRQPPGRQHIFHMRHDVFTPERRENRLLRSALDICFRIAKDPASWRLANELRHLMSDIHPYQQPQNEMPLWQHNRLMAAYSGIKLWTQVIIDQLNPDFQAGSHKGIALLLPMQRLFEATVERVLKTKLPHCTVTGQPRRHSLAAHTPKPGGGAERWFTLKPDLLVEAGDVRVVLDAKWKLIDEHKSSGDAKYDLSQADFYQLYAYGQKYLGGEGALFLIYPRYDHFTAPLPPFELDDDLRLWVVPYDLHGGNLVSGSWAASAPVLSSAASELLMGAPAAA